MTVHEGIVEDPCPECDGHGWIGSGPGGYQCPVCGGTGEAN